MLYRYIFMALVASSVLLACSNQTAVDATANQNKEIELNERTFDKLAAKRIYFGHMSVGSNIMAGVQDILSGYSDATLAVLETEMIPADGNGIFAHGPIGDNEYPLKKIVNFTEKINGGIGGKADIAFFKFCYIDMMADQDAEKVFAAYDQSMGELKQKFPETTFVHVTVPLTIAPKGWKVTLKKLFGKAPGWYYDNINRNRYNLLLHTAYSGKEPLFDLASIEATTPEGLQTTFNWNGKRYISLYPGYASDGRHLNEQGRRHVAQQLLLFLADI